MKLPQEFREVFYVWLEGVGPTPGSSNGGEVWRARARWARETALDMWAKVHENQRIHTGPEDAVQNVDIPP